MPGSGPLGPSSLATPASGPHQASRLRLLQGSWPGRGARVQVWCHGLPPAGRFRAHDAHLCPRLCLFLGQRGPAARLPGQSPPYPQPRLGLQAPLPLAPRTPLLAMFGALGTASETPPLYDHSPPLVSSQPELQPETPAHEDSCVPVPGPPPVGPEFQDTFLEVPGGHAFELTVGKVRSL